MAPMQQDHNTPYNVNLTQKLIMNKPEESPTNDYKKGIANIDNDYVGSKEVRDIHGT